MTTKDDGPFKEQIFRYWVELRDLRDGSVRELPVSFVQKILLATTKRRGKARAPEAPAPPPKIRMRVQDGERMWDAADRWDLARQLREEYPDGVFERTMECERDLAAEERYNAAMNSLMEIIVRSAVRKMLAEQPGE